MKKSVILPFVIFLLASGITFGQNEHPVTRPVQYFIGLQPGFSIRPFDQYRSAVNVNVTPFLFEFAATSHLGIRLHPIFNIQFRPEFPAVAASTGVDLSFPYYFSKKKSEEGHRGFYLAALTGFLTDQLNDFFTASATGEIGYAFVFQNVLSVSVAAKAGSQFQINPTTGFVRVFSSTGGRICFGLWF